MNQAALNVYRGLREAGTQSHLVDQMQTRADLYDFLGYHEYEQKLDALFSEQTEKKL
jgi:methylisocitrate lyase